MDKLTINLQHCYGIRKLTHAFNFSKYRAYAIYAPNGSMKTSLAQTFRDAAEGEPSRDRIFPERETIRSIVDENGDELPPESLLVIKPYDEEFGHTEKTSTLLVNSKLRKEYESLYADTQKAKDNLLEALGRKVGTKRRIDQEISRAFTASGDEFYRAILRVWEEVKNQNDAPFADVEYDLVFDDGVVKYLHDAPPKAVIEEYVKRYNELLAASTYFRKGVFNYYNAATIAQSLADNGFFDAKHTVRLNAQESLEITTRDQLEQLIESEKANITNDPELKKSFTKLAKLLERNQTMRALQEYLSDRGDLLPLMSNMDDFKEKVWKSHLRNDLALYEQVVSCYRKAQQRSREIQEQAARQRTQWERVIEMFNERFFVPFKLEATNRTSVMLGQEPMLVVSFTFRDGHESASVEKKALMQTLSNGEQKALYILNVIFEIEVRKQAGQETVFVIDDIADSFDYKNKYAIIQYLKEVADEPNFRQIVLTHNFDFFRTVNYRFVHYSHCLLASKDRDGISLTPAAGIRNVFANDWKRNFFSDPRKRIASIPFLRNLIEYTRGEDNGHFRRLTSLLHWKQDSSGISQQELDEVYNAIFFHDESFCGDAEEKVIDSILAESRGCLDDREGVNFENKIILSIGIRVGAERYMVTKINDQDFVARIEAHQTAELVKRFTERFGNEEEAVKTMQRVALMTPENIHLNAFMYEPILDMSDDHLRKLFANVDELLSSVLATPPEPE